MFDQQGFLAWSLRLGLSDAARLTIDCIRKSEPSRRGGGGRHNVTGRYPSRKMGVTIQFESHRVELPAIYELEHDADVIEYITRIDIVGEKIAGYARQEKRTLRTLGFTIGFDLPVRFSGCFSGTSSFLKTI